MEDTVIKLIITKQKINTKQLNVVNIKDVRSVSWEYGIDKNETPLNFDMLSNRAVNMKDKKQSCGVFVKTTRKINRLFSFERCKIPIGIYCTKQERQQLLLQK